MEVGRESISVQVPANSADPVGFYHNVSGRMRQPSLRHRRQQEEEARHSFARQADLHKSPRTQELEEFAAKFEGYQKQRTRRMASSAAMAQPTPILDQLARETNNQFWLGAHPDQLSTLESSLLRLVQRNDSISNTRAARGLYTDDLSSSSGRESVATVISNSSSDTIKFNERHSSSETLKYYEPSDETSQGEAVRSHGGHRTGSICDEHFLGHDTNHNNTWLSHGAKRQLYRSHSEAGTRDDVTGHVDPGTWQGCSYCGAGQPQHHDACPMVAEFRQDPVSDNNMVSTIWITRMCLNWPPCHGPIIAIL